MNGNCSQRITRGSDYLPWQLSFWKIDGNPPCGWNSWEKHTTKHLLCLAGWTKPSTYKRFRFQCISFHQSTSQSQDWGVASLCSRSMRKPGIVWDCVSHVSKLEILSSTESCNMLKPCFLKNTCHILHTSGVRYFCNCQNMMSFQGNTSKNAGHTHTRPISNPLRDWCMMRITNFALGTGIAMNTTSWSSWSQPLPHFGLE